MQASGGGEVDEVYPYEELYNNHPSIFTNQQLWILETTGVITAIPSLIGSGLIIYSILVEGNYVKRMYQRIMLGLSTIDCMVSSAWLFLGPWAIPRQVNFVLGAKAPNFVLCNISGFLMNFMMGTMWYSAFLALFFALLVGHDLQESKIKRYFEPLMHTIAFVPPFVTGVYAVSREYMNPIELLPGNCWMDFYCDHEVCRGMNFYRLSLFCGALTVAVTFLIVLLSLVRIIIEVHKTEKKIRDYLIDENHDHDIPSSNDSAMVLTRETCIKALLYIAAYILTFAAGVAIQVLPLEISVKNRQAFFIMGFLTKLFSPLQGFFNSFIFFRYKTSAAPLRSRVFGHTNVMAFTEPHRERPPVTRLNSNSSIAV